MTTERSTKSSVPQEQTAPQADPAVQLQPPADQTPPADSCRPAEQADGADQPAPGQSVAEAVQAAADAEQAREEAAREEAAQSLKACVKAYRQGERAYRAGLLESGRQAALHVAQRLALGDERAAARQAIEGQLAAYASGKVDANCLVGCWEAYRLLAVEPVTLTAEGLKPAQGLATAPKGKTAPADAVPYGHYRDAWRRLADRVVAADKRSESWVLLPGMESECCEAFGQAVKAGLSLAAVQEQVDKLLAEHKRRANAAAQQAAVKAAADKAAADRAALDRDRELLAAQAAARQAEQAASAEQDQAAREAKEQDAARLKAEQEAAQKAKAAADFAAEQAARDKARADQEAKDAARLQAEADGKAAAKAARAARQGKGEADGAGDGPAAAPAPAKGKPEGECRGENILAQLARTAKAAQPREFAGMLAGPVHGAGDPLAVVHELARALVCCPPDADGYGPDSVLEAFLDSLVQHPELSRRSQRAVQAALLVLKGTSPADVASARAPAGNPAPAPVAVTAGK